MVNEELELEEQEELDEYEEEIEEEETEEESTELNEFETCIKDYLDNFESEFFKTVYNPEKIKDCCAYIIGEVKKSKRSAFTDEEIYKMARDYFVDKKEVKTKETCKKIIVPTKKKEESDQQMSLFDF